MQSCGKRADQIYKCEEIGPHENHKVGDHTIVHERYGNGYSCARIEEAIQKLGRGEALVSAPIKYTVIGR
jgi:hypothetical protein